MKTRALAIGALALFLPLAAAACGGKDDNNSGSRPTVAELQKNLAGVGQDDSAAKCLAEELEASSLPNGVITKISKGEDPEVDKDNHDKYKAELEKLTQTCIKKLTAEATGK